MKKIIVTGGAGFIGSNLVRRLITEYPSSEIIVIDNLSTGSEKNLEEIKDKITFTKADIRNLDSIKDLFRDADLVFHEAAIPSVPRSIKEPIPSHETNITGTFNVLLASKEAGVKRVIYAASSSAYGDTLELPKKETFVSNPKSPYGLQKFTGEQYCKIFTKVYGLETISLRYFNVFGPHQNPNSPYSGIVSLFMKSIINKTPPSIDGDGEQTRDFTYVGNIVDLNIKAAQSPTIIHELYNGGTGNRYSLNTVWQTLQEIEGTAITPVYTGKKREGDVKDSQADISLAREDLGYSPKFDLKTGLKETLEWYKKNLN